MFTFIFFATLGGFALFVAYFTGRCHGWGLGFDEAERLFTQWKRDRGLADDTEHHRRLTKPRLANDA